MAAEWALESETVLALMSDKVTAAEWVLEMETAKALSSGPA